MDYWHTSDPMDISIPGGITLLAHCCSSSGLDHTVIFGDEKDIKKFESLKPTDYVTVSWRVEPPCIKEMNFEELLDNIGDNYKIGAYPIIVDSVDDMLDKVEDINK